MEEYTHPAFKLYQLKQSTQELEAGQDRIRELLDDCHKLNAGGDQRQETLAKMKQEEKEFNEWLDKHSDDEWDDHFQNGGGHE